MKPSTKRRPIEYLSPDLSAERVARMWGVIEANQKPSRAGSRRTMVWVAAACAVAACLALFVHFRARPSLTATGDVIETGERGTSLNLPDGSALVLSEAAKLNVVSASPSAVSLHLERGRVTCEVTHVLGRRFAVEALGITVEVKGTHFTVDVGQTQGHSQQVTVRVERGVVEVHDRNAVLLATMTAGQTWSSPATEVTSSAPVEPESSAAASEPLAPPAPAPTAVVPAVDAATLFERANAARIAGRAGDAAADYDRFRLRFPQDSRAGLAAFELGRIPLDSLHDPKRALSALGFALSHNRGGFASEDAEALRVDALNRLGDQAACSAARAAFLSAHPKSAHAPRVSRACSPG